MTALTINVNLILLSIVTHMSCHYGTPSLQPKQTGSIELGTEIRVDINFPHQGVFLMTIVFKVLKTENEQLILV